MSDDEPTRHNELVRLVEVNEPSVVASVIRETHIPKSELRGLWERGDE